MTRSIEVHLVRRPDGMPTETDFALVERDIADPGAGEVAVQNLIMSVDPYMRPRMAADQRLGVALEGGAIGRVTGSNSPKFKAGDLVRSQFGFREAFVAPADALRPLGADPAVPLSVYMHALGGTGFTAYGGLLEIGKLKDGEEVFVSTAAGAVGSVAVQIAKIRGCRVVGSTGSEAKAEWLREVAGVDVAINYHATPIGRALEAATPKGVDVYFDNVGGDHLDAALRRMNTLGRIAVCGMIASYNGAPQPVTGLSAIIYGRVNIRGFVGTDFPEAYPRFMSEMTQWVKDGRIRWQETVHEGVGAAPGAFVGLMKGENLGKMLVRIAD